MSPSRTSNDKYVYTWQCPCPLAFLKHSLLSFNRKAAASAVVKAQHVSDDGVFKVSRIKEKSRARLSTPIEVSSGDDLEKRPLAMELVALVAFCYIFWQWSVGLRTFLQHSVLWTLMNRMQRKLRNLSTKGRRLLQSRPQGELSLYPVVCLTFTRSLQLLVQIIWIVCRRPFHLPRKKWQPEIQIFLTLLSTQTIQWRVLLMLLKTYEIPRPTNLSFSSLVALVRCLNRLCWCAHSLDVWSLNLMCGLLSSLEAAEYFEQCTPFANPALICPDSLLVGDYKHLIWPGSKRNAIFTMLGAVTSCNVIHSTAIGNHTYRAVTIIPCAPSFAGFTSFLGKKYACNDIFGPLEFGCLFTFTSRREGLSSACLSYRFIGSFGCINEDFDRWVYVSHSEY